MKRIIALLQCIVFLCVGGILCAADAYAEQDASYKTVYINVAQNKPVTVSEDFIQEMASYPLFAPEKMTDGKITSCALGTFPTDSYIQVDLQRKYLLKEITLTDRYDADHAPIRTNLEILASNDESFSSFDIIDYVGENADEKFSYKGKWEIKLDGKKPYRYIRVKMNHTAYGGFGELQAFADQTVTQLDVKEAYASRETVSEGYTYSASFAIDGKNANAGNAWVADGNDIYHYIRFTIPENKHIGMIEIEDRYENGNTTTRQADAFYGSDSYIDHETAITLNSFSAYEEYTYLGTTGHYGDYPATEVYPYPAYPGGMYRVNFNDEKAFKYFTMKKDYPLSATIGEIRFFEVNPQIISFDNDIKTKTATISFSDGMDFSSVSENTFTLTDGEETVYLSGKATDSYTYVLDLSSLEKEKTYTLTISKELKSLKNAGLCEDYIKSGISISDYSSGGINISDKNAPDSPVDLYSCEELTLSSDITNNTKEEKNFLLIYTQYDKENFLIKTDVAQKTLKASSHDTISLDHKLSIAPGDSIKAFLWTEDLRPVAKTVPLTTPYKNIYVSENGDDKNTGTAENPVATIKRAQQIVRKINSSMEEDINVFISDGVFVQNEPLIFTTADSGKNNFNVNYIGSKSTVISGGQKVENFEKVNDSGLYCAEVDIDSVRELYINGKKAIRAQSESRIKPTSVYEENGIKEGFIIEKDAFSSYKNPSDIQFHYHRSWRSLVLNVSSIEEVAEGYLVKMKQPEFSYAAAPLGEGFSFWVDETNGFYIENAFELLDNENEFYYDKSEKKLYYKTLSTDMSEAEVYIPALEQLINIKGDNLKNKVRNITFDNLTFAHCAFKMPDNGYLGDQAQRFESLSTKNTSYPLDTTIVGAGIRISKADNIDFEDSSFYGMGAVALGLYDGSENCDITGNAFYDINDSAITVGLPSDAYMQTNTRSDNEIALYKPTTATTETKHYPSCYANDGDSTTGWTMSAGENGSYLDKYWQVDLKKEYTISNIAIKARKGYDQKNTRRSFEVLGSNDENFSEGSYSVLASQGSEEFSIEDGFSADVTDLNKYRYIRVRKTADEYFFLADIEIYTSDEEYIPSKEVCKNNNIKNNYITNIGLYNSGAPGIQSYYTEGLTISHNTIKNVPYSGIALGWGWTQTADSTTSKNNIISDNLIDTYNLVNFDGGGIYTLGQQPGSIISGNYIKNQINGHAGYYPDSGSSEYTVTNNVIEDSDIPFFLYGPQSNLTLNTNYANSNNTVYNNKGTDCTVETQIFFIPGKESEEILSIKNNAGLEEKYKSLLSVPYEKEAITTDTDYNYGNALDENKWNIGAMQDPKFLELYLEYLISYADDLYNTGSFIDKFTNQKYTTLYSKLEAAKTAYDTAEKQITYATYDSETGIYAVDEGMTMDRKAVINARLNLKAAIAEFLSN